LSANNVVTKTCLYPEHVGSVLCDIEEFYRGASGKVSDYCKRCEKHRKRLAYWAKQGFDIAPSIDPVKAAMKEQGLKLTDYCAVCYKPIDKAKHRTYCYACTGKIQYAQKLVDQSAAD
jgi:hypothetical protein